MKNGHPSYFMINLQDSYVAKLGSELMNSGSDVKLATNCAMVSEQIPLHLALCARVHYILLNHELNSASSGIRTWDLGSAYHSATQTLLQTVCMELL